MEPIIQFFAYEHLPPHLQEVSKPFGDLARAIVDTLPRNPERQVCIRTLLLAAGAWCAAGFMLLMECRG